MPLHLLLMVIAQQTKCILVVEPLLHPSKPSLQRFNIFCNCHLPYVLAPAKKICQYIHLEWSTVIASQYGIPLTTYKRVENCPIDM